MPDIVVLYNRANTYGLAKDVEGLEAALGPLRRADPLEPPTACDLLIHLEVPVYQWMPWAAQNILMVNPEWFQEAWLPYMPRFDAVIYKDQFSAEEAVAKGYVDSSQVRVVPWGCKPSSAAPKLQSHVTSSLNAVSYGFVWFLGASVSKHAYVPRLIRRWKESYPPLRIYSVAPVDISGVTVPANVRFEVQNLDTKTRDGLAQFFRGHVCCSAAEGFSYPAAEAEWAGAFTILNDLNCFRADYTGQPGAHVLRDSDSLDAAMIEFDATNFALLTATRRAAALTRWNNFQTSISIVVNGILSLGGAKPSLPPILLPEDCPPISIVTLLYNRRRFFELACHSMLLTDYPKDKIEWIIVEDSDTDSASDRVVAVANAAAPLRVEYIPLKNKTPVAEKRNIGVAAATAEIILMMDDDDHYPETSFRRRVAWLTKHPWRPRAVAATTIACYDLVKGISAVNTPPMGLPLGQRISEATLTFYKGWSQFPSAVQVGEGEGFIAGREEDVLEIPPQQIIIAFSHGANVSSRRIPSGADVKPGCFWGFPKEFLVFVHGLAGVKVVQE